MKRKIVISILIIIMLVSTISVAIIAFNQEISVMDKMQRFSEYQIIEHIDESNSNIERNINTINVTDKAKKYMKENKLLEDDESDLNIQLITNNITGQKYYRIEGKGARIDILKNTGELRGYINSKPTTYIEGTTYEIEKVETVAKKIMQTNELLKNNQNYEFIRIEESLTYYPTAWFNDNKNNQQLFMIFNPDGEEIIVIGTKSIPVSENNEIKIKEETAKKIAINKLGMSKDNIIKVEQKEVVPNEMYLEPGYYAEMKIKRNAYVITFDTIGKHQVYIDATTGEIIGGNAIW